MSFRPRAKAPEFADLKGILAQSRRHLDQATYQTIQEIIERLSKFKQVEEDNLDYAINDPLQGLRFATRFATFLTEQDETSVLPNSRRLIAGTNITFNVATPGQLVINATGGSGGGTWSVLTNGNVTNPELIYAGGDVIMTHI